MSEIERFKEEILRDYPRMTENSTFKFACHKGLSCFNECCADVNIFLTPYDVIRLRNRLGISSQEFLDQHTIVPFDKNLKYPILLLEMRDEEKKRCPFVAESGCQVYEDRPWACRMYPLGLASPRDGAEQLPEEFYFLLKEAVCRGFGEPTTQTVIEWKDNQGIKDYGEMGADFKELTLHPIFQEGGNLTPQKIEMFFLVCYNIDKFRDLVFGSSFLDKFVVDEEIQNRIKKDDVQLLKFGYGWLRFALFGEKTMTVRSEVLAEKKKELAMRQMLPDPPAGG